MAEETNENTDVDENTESTLGDSTALQDERTVYELGYHLVPSLSSEQVEKEQALIKALIEKQGGLFISLGAPKRMQLAYTMVKKVESKGTKFDQSYFGWIKFEMLPAEAVALKEVIDTRGNVLRFIIVKTIREHVIMRDQQVTFTRKPEEEKIPEKVVVKTKETGGSKPVSDEELDKTIEELVAN